MELLTFILLITILIIVLTAKGNAKKQATIISKELDELSKKIKLIESLLKNLLNENFPKITPNAASVTVSLETKKEAAQETEPILQKPLESFIKPINLIKEEKVTDKIEMEYGDKPFLKPPPPPKAEYFHKPIRPTFLSATQTLKNLLARI